MQAYSILTIQSWRRGRPLIPAVEEDYGLQWSTFLFFDFMCSGLGFRGSDYMV